MMKKQFKPRHATLAGLAFALSLLCTPAANADLLLNDDFSSYTPGNLYKQNGWVRRQGTPSAGTDITVEAFPMSYPGYCSSVTNAAKIGMNSGSQEQLKKQFREKSASTGPLYYAFLLNVSDITSASSPSYFFAFVTAHSNSESNVTEGTAGDEHGRVFVYKNSYDAAGTYRLGFSKYAGTKQVGTDAQTFNVGETVLVICKWVWVDGTTNDYYEFWVNPTYSAAEPAAHFKSATSGSDVVVGTDKKPLQGIEIRQANSNKTPGGHIGAIKVATSWADLWEDAGGGEQPVQKPAISVNKTTLEMGTYQGMGDVTASVVVKGANLTGDISVSGLTNLTPSVTSIPKEDAMSDDGYTLTLTLSSANALPMTTETLTLESEDAAAVSVSIKEQVAAVIEKPALSGLNNLSEDDYNVYKYTGHAVVTYVDNANDIIYAQDATGGIKISTGYYFGSQQLKRGDQITDIYCSAGDAYGGHSIMPIADNIATVESQNNAVEPIEVLLSEYNSQRVSYLSRLVKITDVIFTNAGATFGTASSPFKQGEAEGFVRTFAGTDLIGTEIPATAAAIIGIPTSASSSIISMRDKEDLLETPPSITVNHEVLTDKDVWKEVATEYVHSKVKIQSAGLKQAAQIYLSGADRDHFSIDKDQIPTGNTETEVTVTYKPSAAGTHSAIITIDAVPAELSQTLKISDKAWDPKNPPMIEVNADNIVPFETNVGDEQVQTLSYSAKGLLDYGTVRVVSETPGHFVINNSTLMKDGTYDIQVTFCPKAEGSFNATLEFSANKAETRVVELTGKTTGYREPEARQGDELTFDTSNPHATLAEDFEQSGTHNNPLQIDEWKNVAVTGTRAWWAYTFEDTDNTVAKVTPYDSFAETEEPCEMLLLSPALSYEKAPNRLLAFRLMGQYLSDAQSDLLEVLYVDATNPENPYYEPIQGLDIPASSDYNNEWVPYVIDLNGQNLAEPFFIGFRFKSQRGKENAATYYVDDFSWGKDDVPYITAEKAALEFEAEAGKEFTSDDITILGHNLTGNITLTVADEESAKLFTVAPVTLPAAGGKFTLCSDALTAGTYNVQVRAEAADAPALLIDITVKADEAGINGIDVDNAERADVYTLTGVLVGRQLTAAQARAALAPGIYIHGTSKLIVE